MPGPRRPVPGSRAGGDDLFTAAPTDAERGTRAARVQSPPYRLGWRSARQEYVVQWYCPRERRGLMRSLGVGAGESADPPRAAVEAFHAWVSLQYRPPAEASAEVRLAQLFQDYLTEHVRKLRDEARTSACVTHWLRFLIEERRAGRVDAGGASVDDVNDRLVERYIAARKAAGVGGPTISREIAALRGAVRHAWKKERVKKLPFIRDIDEEDRVDCREIELSPEQIAGIFEAAVARIDRFHVADFVFAHLSSHARTEAILECDLDVQYDRVKGNINWLPPGRRQSRKARSITRVGPSFAERLAARSGRLILCRGFTAEKSWAREGVPEFWSKPVADIGRAWSSVLVAAHERDPRLGLATPVLDEDGRQLTAPVFNTARRQIGERLLWEPIGPPNTLRHTIHTYLEAAGVPEAQIDSMSGHNRRKGSGAKYLHVRPEYQRDAIAAIEAYWEDLDRLTNAHRRIHFASSGGTVVDLATAKLKKSAG